MEKASLSVLKTQNLSAYGHEPTHYVHINWIEKSSYVLCDELQSKQNSDEMENEWSWSSNIWEILHPSTYVCQTDVSSC